MKQFVIPFLVAAACAVHAQTAVVSGDTASLLQAIADAQPGETVLVPEGTYELTSQLEVTKDITLKASGDVASTILKRVGTSTDTKADHEERAVYMNSASAVLDGFTITGGRLCGVATTFNGAGLLIGEVGGTARNCVVRDNVGGGKVTGIGAAALSAASVFTGCSVVGNYEALSPSRGCNGAGVYLCGGKFEKGTVANNQINVANAYNCGGGFYLVGGIVDHVYITNNYVRATDYSSSSGGGGIAIMGESETIIANCLISGNSTLSAGGGIFAKYACKIVNCTIIGNTAVKGAGGIRFDQTSKYGAFTGIMRNCIVADNKTTGSAEFTGKPNWGRGQGKYNLLNCLSPAFPETQANVNPVTGDPIFDTSVCDGYPDPNSPSVNAGAAGVFDDIPSVDATTDLLGNARTIDTIDIGAFEYKAPDFKSRIDVTKPAKALVGETFAFTAIVESTDLGTRRYRWRFDAGAWTDWTEESTAEKAFAAVGAHTVELETEIGGVAKTPFASSAVSVYPSALRVAKSGGDYSDLNEAISHAGDGTVVTVGAGVYEIESELVLAADIELASEAGAEATEIRRVNTSSEKSANVIERVMTIDAGRAVVRGFTISGGRIVHAAETTDAMSGAGVRIGAKGGWMSSCVVTNCSAGGVTSHGVSGIGVSAEGEGAVVSNCVVRDNFIFQSGSTGMNGALYLGKGLFVDGLVISNVLSLSGASAYNNGGGVCVGCGTLRRTRIEGNALTSTVYSSNDGGAGVAVVDAGCMENCVVISNRQTGGYCGGVIVKHASALVRNCLIVGNSSTKTSGTAVKIVAGTVENCTVAGNGESGAEVSLVALEEGMLHNAIVWGNGNDTVAASAKSTVSRSLFAGASGNGNLDCDPHYRKAAAGNYRPAGDSPVRSAGEYADWMSSATDLSGRPRVRKVGKVDMGGYALDPLGLKLLVK